MTIPNFVGRPGTLSLQTNKQIITVARLEAIKGIDFLLTVAHAVLTKHPDWKWLLIGNGELKDSVLTYIANNNLEDKLLLIAPGYKDLTKLYAESSIYVCTSRYESFGLTIAEAMSCGLPVVSFDCESGPKSIITCNEDGILVEKENPEKLAAAISSLIEDETLRRKLGKKAIQNIQRFSPDAVYSQWESLFAGL